MKHSLRFHDSQAGAQGFTLLEILVALAVIAIALAAITEGVSANARNSAYLRDRTLATWVAENRLAELQLQADWPSTGKDDGSMELGSRSWHWTTLVKNSPDPDIREITIEVRAERGDKATLANWQGYLGRPQDESGDGPGLSE